MWSENASAPSSVHQKFSAALQSLVEQVKRDRSILAAVLCGSLSHDTVWVKSDIDLVLVTIDGKKPGNSALALYADGINVHAILIPRDTFRTTVEGAIRHSFMHSLLAKGRLLYSHDEAIAELCAGLQSIGRRDTQVQLLAAASHSLPSMDKAHKWFITRGDLDYTALWILHAAVSLAKVEVIGAGLLVDREALPQALKLNPGFFKTVYTDLLNTKKTTRNVQAALTAMDDYLLKRAPTVFAPVIDHLREVGEARSATEIDDHFQRNFGVEGVTGVCEYLSDQGILRKVSLPVRLTTKSNVNVEELAFVHATRVADAC
jgi:hypothetical protein